MAFTGFLVLGALDLAFGDGLVVRRLAGLVLVCVVALLVIGVLRSVVLLKRVRETTWRDAIGAFGIWMGLGWAVAIGAARGLFAREGAFLRTPKVKGDLTWRDALRGNRVETSLALLVMAVAGVAFAQGTWPGVLLGSLLAWQGLGHAMAPLNSLAAIRADLPADLRRRRLLVTSWSRLPRPARRAVLWPAIAGAALASTLVALAAPADAPIGRLDLVPGGRPGEAGIVIEPLEPSGSQEATSNAPGAPTTAPTLVQPAADTTTGALPATSAPGSTEVGATAQGGTKGPATPAATTATVASQPPPGSASSTPTQAPTRPTQAPTDKGQPTSRPTTQPTQKGKPTAQPTPSGAAKGKQPTTAP